jgi:hypothetical protein
MVTFVCAVTPIPSSVAGRAKVEGAPPQPVLPIGLPRHGEAVQLQRHVRRVDVAAVMVSVLEIVPPMSAP